MDKRDIILGILEDNVMPLVATKIVTINTNNGVLNNKLLEKEKRKLLTENITYITDEVVRKKQGYPVNDLSDVELSTDLAILKYKDYLKIKNYIDGISEKR